MIAVITGDIISSRKMEDQEVWLSPLKKLFNTWGKRSINWEIERGDFFQIEIPDPKKSLERAIEIKSLLRKTPTLNKSKTTSPIDVRMAIGIGQKTYSGETISESNGTAFIYSGEKFDLLKKENITIGIKTSWHDFDEEINLYLKLTSLFMDKWTISSAELSHIVLQNPHITQNDIGKQLGIKQNSVSGRWNRANISEILAVNEMFKKKIENLIK